MEHISLKLVRELAGDYLSEKLSKYREQPIQRPGVGSISVIKKKKKEQGL